MIVKTLKNISGYLLLAILILSSLVFSTKVFAADPIEIYTLEDLDNIRNDLSASYILMNDLDFQNDADYENVGNKTIWTTGEGWDPIGKDYRDEFTGTFDGQDHIISNLYFDRTYAQYADLLGLFGGIQDGTIIDIGLEDVDVTGREDVWLGGLLGYNLRGSVTNAHVTGSVNGISTAFSVTLGGLIGGNEGGEVTNSHFTGTIIGTGKSSYVGGLIGYNVYHVWSPNILSVITNCYSTGSVSTQTTFSYSIGIGGLVGYNEGSTIIDSYSTSSVTISGTTYYIGGLTGYNDGVITNSYATGNITEGDDGDYVGGLVGENYGTVTNSFWDTQTSGMGTSEGGTGKTTAEMKTISTFSGTWDIVEMGSFDPDDPSVWYIDDTNDYAHLFWEFSEPDEPEEPEIIQPEIITQTATDITTNSARLRGNLTSLGSFSTVQVYFQYRQIGGTWIDTPEETKTSIGEYTYELTDINPNTDYEYRSVEEFGDSDTIGYGAIQSFSTLPVVIPKVRITDIGLITNVVDRDEVLYYFTSTIARIRGIAYPNTTVKFETDDEIFTAQADSNGAFNITLTLPRGRSDIEYYAYDAYDDISATRILALVIGTEYFPEWLLINLGLVTPEEEEPTEEVIPVDEDSQEEEDETDEIETSESEIQILQFLDNEGNPIIGALVEINDQEYYTDSNGEIEVEGLDSNTKYEVKIEYNGIKYEVEISGPGIRGEKIVIRISEEDMIEGSNWNRILTYEGLVLVGDTVRDFTEDAIKIVGDATVVKLNEGQLQTVVATTSLITVTVGLSTLAGGFSQIVYLIMQTLNGILNWFGFKRKKVEVGFVYDSYTKEPISGAVVRIYNSEGGLAGTSVTDKTGSFVWELKTGIYRIEVKKKGFIFPSKLVKGKVDLPIQNVYLGKEFVVSEGDIVNFAIPLDPTSLRSGRKGVMIINSLFDNMFAMLNVLLFTSGIGMMVYMNTRYSSTTNLLLSLIYIPAFYALITSFIGKGKRFGVIKDINGKLLSGIQVEVRELEFNKLVAKRVSDERGRYRFVLPKGKYQLGIQQKDYFIDSVKGGIEIDSEKEIVINRKIVVKHK